MNNADFYFMTNLHLMFDKESLKKLRELEGSSLKDAFSQKYIIEKSKKKLEDGTIETEKGSIEKEEYDRYESITEMLRDLFHSMKGGGMSIEALKELIRGKIKAIKPR
jgi:hypothetical protein